MTRNFTIQQHSNKSRKKKRDKPTLVLEMPPTVHSLNDLIELAKSIKFYRNLDTVMLWRISPYLEELNAMIGMKSLKETMFYQVIYYLKGMNKKSVNDEYLHTMIMGKPGTGKTTVARIIAKIYTSMGVLSKNGPFKVAYRDDFIAEYLGQTAIKTRKLLNSCIGGVLFVDEVYSLSSGRKDRDSFSQEALDTLTVFLDTHMSDFCFIGAGYEEDINNRFFKMNDGLSRRFPHQHKIEEYVPSELALIFKKKIADITWNIAFDDEYIVNIIKEHKELFEFAGGSIQTFVGKMKFLHAKRVFNLDHNHQFVFTKDDVKNTIKYIKEHSIIIDNKQPPLGMYL
jgi:SpoVK/Ycf46/Vps4 family AAA+-type ATPase